MQPITSPQPPLSRWQQLKQHRQSHMGDPADPPATGASSMLLDHQDLHAACGLGTQGTANHLQHCEDQARDILSRCIDSGLLCHQVDVCEAARVLAPLRCGSDALGRDQGLLPAPSAAVAHLWDGDGQQLHLARHGAALAAARSAIGRATAAGRARGPALAVRTPAAARRQQLLAALDIGGGKFDFSAESAAWAEQSALPGSQLDCTLEYQLALLRLQRACPLAPTAAGPMAEALAHPMATSCYGRAWQTRMGGEQGSVASVPQPGAAVAAVPRQPVPADIAAAMQAAKRRRVLQRWRGVAAAESTNRRARRHAAARRCGQPHWGLASQAAPTPSAHSSPSLHLHRQRTALVAWRHVARVLAHARAAAARKEQVADKFHRLYQQYAALGAWRRAAMAATAHRAQLAAELQAKAEQAERALQAEQAWEQQAAALQVHWHCRERQAFHDRGFALVSLDC